MNKINIEYICLYCPAISKTELLFLNIANFLTLLNAYFEIDGKKKTLIEHLKDCSLYIDDRTIDKMVNKCASRKICEDILTLIYNKRDAGWPYQKIKHKFISISLVAFDYGYIRRHFSNKKDKFMEVDSNLYCLKDNDLSDFDLEELRRFIAVAKKINISEVKESV